MGQTLTHGVYLPAEGERNCYDGLASNWSILDNSVGTIAEHTTALAGKAPAVHTHTKSDVTDLLNSNFIPSANNSYDLGSSSYQWNNLYAKNYYYNGIAWGLDKANQWSSEQTCKSNNPKWINRNNNITLGVAPASNQTSAFYNYDKNGNEIGRFVSRVQPDGKTVTWLAANNLYKNGQLDPTGNSVWANLYCAIDANGYPHVSTDCALTPNANNSYDLGSSSKQWLNTYSKGYYYNGVAWGLDKANVWTGQNTFNTTVIYDGNFAWYWKRANLTAGTLPSSTMYYGSTRYADSAGTTIVLNRGLVDTSGKNYFRQYTYAFNDTSKYCSMGSGINADGSNSYFAFNAESVIPGDNNTTDLGTSTNKWKSFNGINPGALSLPDSASSQTLDVSAQGLNWDLTGATDNTYTPTFSGWLQLRCKDIAGNFLFATTGNVRQSVSGMGYISDLNAGLALTIPIEAGRPIGIRCKASSKFSATVMPCFGNV